MEEYLGTILSIDQQNTKRKEDAFSLNYDEDGNYLLNIYISDPITGNEKNIKNIIRKTLQYDGSYKGTYLRNQFSDYSLCEEEEKPVFSFCFTISKEGDLIDFCADKRKIAVDFEMTETDVVEVIEDEAPLFEYLAEINYLAEILYQKVNHGREFNTFGPKVRFDFLFPGQFIMLANAILTDMVMKLELPLIYSVTTTDEQINNKVEPNYFTSNPTKNKFGRYYAHFTSPLREFESLINLSVYNDFVLTKLDKHAYNHKFDFYNNITDGYIRIDDAKEHEKRYR